MLKLTGTNTYLRALELSDLEFLYLLENDTKIWEISGTVTPYSKKTLQLYLDNAHRDIYEVKQLRLCICTKDGKAIGLVDIFDFDPKNSRAGLGIVVLDENDRGKGVGEDALRIVIDYAFSVLNLHQLYLSLIHISEPTRPY